MICEVEQLNFKYPNSEEYVLKNASLSVDKSEVLCILGPNGAGKTTLLNCIMGLLSPQAGEVRLKGENIKNLSEKEIARIAAYVPQLHTPSFDYKVKDFVLMGRAPQMGIFSKPSAEDEKLCMNILDNMNLLHLAEKSYLEISGGERQQLLIARALVQEPEIVIFDEPTAHLDYGNQHRVLNKIKQMTRDGYSVIFTTHNPDHALLLGGKAALVKQDGSILQGTCEEIIREDVMRDIYGIDLRISYVDEIGRTACLVPEL